MSHALCQGCKAEHDMVLALEKPIVKLKREHRTLPFSCNDAISIQMVLVCSVSCLSSSGAYGLAGHGPEQLRQKEALFLFFFTYKNKWVGRISSGKYCLGPGM